MSIVILASKFVIKIFDSLIEYASLCMHQKFYTISPQHFWTPETSFTEDNFSMDWDVGIFSA